MPMEIHPIPGQPGLFRGLDAAHRERSLLRKYSNFWRNHPEMNGLGTIRWTSTAGGAMYHAPFSNRTNKSARLAGLNALLVPGIKQIPTGTWDGQLFQEDIPAGKVAGLLLKMVITTPGPLVPQAALDQLYRAMLSRLGYDVGSSEINAQQIGYTWAVSTTNGANTWDWTITTGPKEILGINGFLQQAPTTADKAALPTTAQTYTVLARPKVGIVTKESLNALLGEMRSASNVLRNQFQDVKTYPFVVVTGVPPVPGTEPPLQAGVGGIGLVLGLIGVGWLSYLSMNKKAGL